MGPARRALLTLVRLLFLSLGRRFEEAYELLAAIGWNVTHAGGTLRRRRDAQRARPSATTRCSRYTASAGLHLPRWFQTAERILEEQRELGEGEAGQPAAHSGSGTGPPRLSRSIRSSSAASSAVLVGASPCAQLSGTEPCSSAASCRRSPPPGRVLPEPSSPDSGRRVWAGRPPRLPGLAALGGISFASFANTALGAEAILIAGPRLATVLWLPGGRPPHRDARRRRSSRPRLQPRRR